MAGIDGITADILAAAREEAGKILAQAQEQAQQTSAKAEEDSKKLFDDIIASARAKAEAESNRAASQAALQKRQALLAQKQEIISSIIERAKTALQEQGDEAYFAMVVKLIKKAARPQDGEIAFGAKDLKRLPEGFEAAANAAAKELGGTLKLAKDPVDIKNGFVLRYGGIEENCSLDALFASRTDSLTDKVNAQLW